MSSSVGHRRYGFADTYINVMDQYSPAWKAKTDEKYRDINREVEAVEMETAYTDARSARLWRFDRRWRSARDRLWGSSRSDRSRRLGSPLPTRQRL